MLKPNLLRQLGQVEEAYQTYFSELIQITHPRIWLEYAGLIFEWLNQSQAQETLQTIIAGLQQTCQQTSLQLPRLLLLQLPPEQTQLSPAQQDEYTQAILDIEAWRPYLQQLGPWLPTIAQLLFAQVGTHLPEQPEYALQLAQTIPAYPWELLQDHDQERFEGLCLVLLQLEQIQTLKNLCQSMQRHKPEWGGLSFWLGYIAYQQGHIQSSLEHFQRVMQIGHPAPHHRLNMLPILLFHGQLEHSRTLLDACDTPDDPFVLQMEIEYCSQTQQTQRGIELCDILLAQQPDFAPARFYKAQWHQEANEHRQAEQTLLPLLPEEEPIASQARLLLTGIYLALNELPNAETHMAHLLPPTHAQSIFQEPQWKRTFAIHYGMLLDKQGRADEALQAFQDALQYEPKAPVYGYILDILWDQKEYEQARQLSLKAVKSEPHEPRLRGALCQIEDFFENWEASLLQHERVGMEWFRQEQRTNEGIWLKTRALLGLGRPLEALHFCEDVLPEMLQDDALTALRKQILKEVQAQFEQLRSQVGEHEKSYHQLEETQRMLAKQREENQRRERAYQHILQRNETLRQTLNTFHTPGFISPQQQEETIDDTILSSLDAAQQAILQSALALWNQLKHNPQHDHGPYILQLARIVEAQLNRYMIDPLCQWTLDNQFAFSDLPRPSINALKPSHNRLSLGDAAQLLYSRVDITEADGSASIKRNPKSPHRHEALLEGFWQTGLFASFGETDKQYWQQMIPGQLETLASFRNRASHANAPLSRQDAGRIRVLVLGHSTQEGLLAKLAQLVPFKASQDASSSSNRNDHNIPS
jgi:tetratricopeptide (TPR) repeat protein